jgi:hypothetical protein
VPAKKLPRVIAQHRAEVHTIALMADRMPTSSDRRDWLHFLGSPTAFNRAPALRPDKTRLFCLKVALHSPISILGQERRTR